MWLTSKQKNRRCKRDEVLDVRVRSQTKRARRWRNLVGVISLAVATLGSLLFLWRGTDWVIEEAIRNNDFFRIRLLDVQTDGIIPKEQITRWSGVKAGDNLMAVELTQVKRNLELVPLIKEASVERVLPNALNLRVTERIPFARAHVVVTGPEEGSLTIEDYFLDREGYVMMPLKTWPADTLQAYSSDLLPLLCGLTRADLRPGHQAESLQVHAALELIASFEQSPMWNLADLVRIDLSAPDVLQVTTSQASEILFSPEQLEPQLQRWRLIHDYGQKTGKVIANLDLSITNNLPVQWVEAAAAPPLKPKPSGATRGRKRHV